MKKVRAVADTNVLYAGLYSSRGASFQILRKVDEDLIVPVLSTTLLFEYEDVLRRNQTVLRLTDRAIQDVLDGFCLRGECQPIYFLWRPQLSDVKDDHILELAVASGTDMIITYNITDFQGSRTFGVRAVTPAEVLEEFK